MARRRRRDRSGSTTNHSRFRGWVYVMDNEAMPEVVKVGYTLDDPVNRAWELRSTGNPYAYVVQYHALVDNPRGLERAVHEKLRQFRGEGEWFAVSLTQAISAIRDSGVRLLFEDDSPRWHPSQPAPSDSSRAKSQRDRERLDRERLDRERLDRERLDRERLDRESRNRERLDRERREYEARVQAKRDLERAEEERREREAQERTNAARSKGDDFKLTVTVTKAKATAGCIANVLSARGQHLRVRCPPGISDGSKLRLREQGLTSRQGGPPGDMIILVKVRE
jgi:hypothetical protein